MPPFISIAALIYREENYKKNMDLQFTVTIAQIIISAVIIILILLQDPSEAGGVFGGGTNYGGFYQTKRGLEKVVFVATIVFAVLFAALALLNLVLPNLQNLF